MPMLGALDMGGSSTQLIFYNGSNDFRKIHADDFWSHSWLNYGVHRIQERVFDYIYTSFIGNITQEDLEMDGDEKCIKAVVIPNPCGFSGHKQPYLGRVIFRGTGEAKKCMDIIERVIWPSLGEQEMKAAYVKGRPSPIESIEHPSVHGHHFYAMSVYFYALDCARHVGPEVLPFW